MSDEQRTQLEPGTQTSETAESRYSSINAAVSTATDATGRSFDIFSTIVAGLILGIGIDWLAGTGPIVTIIGIVLGFVAGFYKLWAASAVLEEQAKLRRR